MKKKIVASICIAMMASSAALATLDRDPDQIGMYFDLEAETTCIELGPSVIIMAYFIITNPTSEVRGFQFKICSETPPGMEGMLFGPNRVWSGECPPPIDTSIIEECRLGYSHSCGQPVPPGPGGVVVMTHQYMLLADIQVDFYMGPSGGADTPNYLGADNEIIPLGLSSGSPDLPVAQINGDCAVVPTKSSTFGRVKATYR